ncbi:hypothetical protein SB49_09925 [Sediminicola sp. YIK13]|uniref:hypothetical protein n=1 Tax=Sediminicola sp. YIK13 TaxID=1453352 RepID=UPI0007230404|nr:hypothetical protein [Sediminicola sp. YIK13]ALM08086.1 hypothetical protein SB49_09925 [Sediminicola sp. YIK13]
MFSKANVLATIIGFVVMFLFGYAIWGIATAEFFEAHATNSIMKNPPDMLFIALGNLIGTFAISTIYGKWAAGAYGAANGFAFGIWIGIFVGLGMGLLWYGTSELMDMTGHLVEAIIDIFFYGIVGAVIGFVYQKTSA